jgi:hypothetical protein
MREATFTCRVDAALKNGFAPVEKLRDRAGAQRLRILKWLIDGAVLDTRITS